MVILVGMKGSCLFHGQKFRAPVQEHVHSALIFCLTCQSKPCALRLNLTFFFLQKWVIKWGLSKILVSTCHETQPVFPRQGHLLWIAHVHGATNDTHDTCRPVAGTQQFLRGDLRQETADFPWSFDGLMLGMALGWPWDFHGSPPKFTERLGVNESIKVVCLAGVPVAKRMFELGCFLLPPVWIEVPVVLIKKPTAGTDRGFSRWRTA